MSKTRIEPRILKGFRDYLPESAIARKEMIDSVQETFVLHGFSPIDTPALEYSEILLGKGSEETDKQLFRFEDNGGRDVSLRFDLTVPLARYIAMHANKLALPFRRYHIAPVWRAEKPQRGRFREFFQCDIDLIGSDSLEADAEVIATISSALSNLGLGHKIKLNHRGISNTWFSSRGLADKVPAILRAIDKLAKIGQEAVEKEIAEQAGLDASKIEEIFAFLKTTEGCSLQESIAALSKIPELEPAAKEVARVIENLASLGISEENLAFDLTIARGLDYYTGIVFETELSELPGIGSIASGGRYDNLVSVYSKKEMPGVGASIGIDRIGSALEELKSTEPKSSLSKAIVLNMGEDTRLYALSLCQKLRANGISTEYYPDSSKLGNQFKFAEKKQIPFAIIAGPEEMASKKCALKNLKTKEQFDSLNIEELLEKLSAAI